MDGRTVFASNGKAAMDAATAVNPRSLPLEAEKGRRRGNGPY